jgi:hypothetical protein
VARKKSARKASIDILAEQFGDFGLRVKRVAPDYYDKRIAFIYGLCGLPVPQSRQPRPKSCGAASRGIVRSRARERRSRAEARWRQSVWLKVRQTDMEDRLAALGLPRDCWRDLQVSRVFAEEPEPLKQIKIGFVPLQSAGLYEWLQENEGKPQADEALWAAAVAWAAHQARNTRVVERRFILGRLIEAFHANLLFPERGREMMKDVQRRLSRDRHAAEAAKLAPVWEFIQSEFRRCRTAGMNPNAAVNHVYGNPKIRQRVQDLVREGRVKPWRGEYYSKRAIRGICERAKT